HVNAYHSQLKSWINNWFKGVATKNLSKYLGWRRALTGGGLALSSFIEKIAGHWVYQLAS
ncbi:MAG: IS1595 family transposase, partial [Endozoicomonas sp. (ex Botrylloides leachii)]|nr:IS1595 family transposase [Endozoicomonas sp. (ex Botrylloides leachii)]